MTNFCVDIPILQNG